MCDLKCFYPTLYNATTGWRLLRTFALLWTRTPFVNFHLLFPLLTSIETFVLYSTSRILSLWDTKGRRNEFFEDCIFKQILDVFIKAIPFVNNDLSRTSFTVKRWHQFNNGLDRFPLLKRNLITTRCLFHLFFLIVLLDSSNTTDLITIKVDIYSNNPHNSTNSKRTLRLEYNMLLWDHHWCKSSLDMLKIKI